jgi:hypothetical protein
MKAITLRIESYSRYFRFDKRLYFLLLCLLIFANSYVMREFIITKDVFYRTYGEQVATERIDQYLHLRDQVKWIVFGFIPVILLIKISLVAVCLTSGAELMNYNLGFKKAFKIALVAEMVFIVATYLRTIGLILFVNINVIQDIQQFSPLSLASVLPMNKFPDWLSYPLLTVNLFEVAYMFALASGVSYALQKNFRQSFRLVFYSYGLGLLIWMVTIVFLSINFS